MPKMKKCPVCGQAIKLENLEKHVKNVHPREKVEIDYSEKEEEKLKAHKLKQKELSKPVGAWKLVAVVTVIIVLVAAFIFITSDQGTTNGPNVGDPAPNFALMDINNNLVNVDGLEGKIIILDFFDTDCGVCQNYVQSTLVPLNKNYSDDITLISIDANIIGEADTITDIIAFKNQYGAEWTFVLDDGTATDLYDIRSTPQDYIINKEGIIAHHNSGWHEYETIAAQIDALP